MAVVHHHEREVTYAVPVAAGDGWPRPDLEAAVPAGGRSEQATHTLRAVYYDTDPALLRPLGVTLRRREGGPDAGWHLKLPSGDGRTEVHSHASGPGVPRALLRRVAGITAGRAVEPVAAIDTVRHTVRLLDAGGLLVAEVADDEVRGARLGRVDGGDGADGGIPVVVWREVEVELGPAGSEADLRAVGALLEAAGAARSGQQRKINQVLGEPPGTGLTGVAEVVAGYLREQCRAILLGDARLRDDPTPDAVHRTRVAVRRLRSTLRLFPHLLAVPAPELARVDAALRWLGGLLSPVRDSDVLGVRLGHELALLPAHDVVGPVRQEVRRALAADRAAGLRAWRDVRDTERYRALVSDLGAWFLATPVSPDERVHPRAVLRRAERSVRRRLERAQDDAGLHQARKAAKRLRYAAEALGGEVRGARTVERRAKRGQSRWGEHQDLVVASAFLRRLADPRRTPAVRSGFTYGVLVARMDRAAGRVRRQATLSRWPKTTTLSR